MKLVRYSVMSILVLGLLVPVQALSSKNKVRFKGAATLALGTLATLIGYKLPDRRTVIGSPIVEPVESCSTMYLPIRFEGFDESTKNSYKGMGIILGVCGLYYLINAQKIAEKIQQEQTA